MRVTAERIDNHKMVLEMEVPQIEVAKALDKAYHKLAGKVNIPGFRKGKVPRKVLETRLGKQALLDEAFEILAPTAYSKALDEQKVEPVSRPNIEVVTLQEDQPLVFKATIVIKPEVTLGQYKGLKVDQTPSDVSEVEVDAQLETIRGRQAKMVVAEGASLGDGDFAIIDFDGYVDGVAFPGGEGKAYPLQIGSNTFIPGFEEQLLGAKAGDEKDVKVTFPQEYHAAELAGKEAIFKVKIQDVKRKELPELDDEFAKDASEFSSLEELKADIRNKLERAAADKAEREFRSAAIKLAVENATVEVPDVMVEDRIDNMIEDLDVNLQNKGMKLDKYLEYVQMDLATLRKNYQAGALMNVKTDLLLEAIAKVEALEVKPEDMQAEIVSMAEAYGTSPQEVGKIISEQGRIATLAESVLRKKAAQLIIDTIEQG